MRTAAYLLTRCLPVRAALRFAFELPARVDTYLCDRQTR